MTAADERSGQAGGHVAPGGQRRWRAGTVFGTLGIVFAALMVILVVLLAVDQQVVTAVAARLQGETVPWTLERQRLGRNLEALRLEGLRVLTARDAGGRDEALFVVRMLAAQPGVGDDPRAAELVAEVEGFLTRVAGGAGRSDMLEWEALSARLRLLADDLSVEGGQRVTAELERMTRVMRLSRYKLMVSVLLMAAFLGSSLFVLRRLLILPLQRIRRELSALDGRAAPPDLPLAALAEIRAVGEALVRFHATLRENEEVRRKLEHLATTDGLTGLCNRRHFMGLAADELARAARYRRPISVAIADLDHFKRINDSFGHAVGDQILQGFAALVGDTLRQTDRVCRYGGEEFAFVFPETAPDEAARLADRLRERLTAAPLLLADGRQVAVTFSIGLADASAGTLEEGLAQADRALYAAKERGRSCTVVAEPRRLQP